MADRRIRLKRKSGRREIIDRIVTLARLPACKRTSTTLTRKQLVELELHLRRADSLLNKFSAGGQP